MFCTDWLYDVGSNRSKVLVVGTDVLAFSCMVSDAAVVGTAVPLVCGRRSEIALSRPVATTAPEPSTG